MKFKKIYIILIIIITFIAFQDFIINGPEKVLGSFFSKLDPGYYGNRIDFEDMKQTTKQGNIVKNKSRFKKLSLINHNGDIKILQSEDDKLKVDYEITVFASEKQQADAYQDKIEVVYEDGVIKVKEPKIRDNNIHSVNVDFVLKLPKGMFIHIKNRSGEVKVNDVLGSVVIENENGSIKVSNFSGELKTIARFSTLAINGVQGKLDIKITDRDAYLTNIKGQINLNNTGCQVVIQDVEGSIDIQNQWGDVEVYESIGDVKLENVRGDGRLEEIEGNVTVYGDSNSELDIEDIYGNIKVEMGTGDIRVELPKEIGFEVSASIENGKVITKLPLKIQQQGFSTMVSGKTIEKAEHNLDIKVKRGKLLIRN